MQFKSINKKLNHKVNQLYILIDLKIINLKILKIYLKISLNNQKNNNPQDTFL